MNPINATWFDPPAVLEERFEVLPASDESRVQVSEQPLFTRGQFNTLRNPITREVTVSAPVLTFNGSIRTLEALRITRDVTRITLIADEVRIEQALQWKGAAVDIHARRLVFRRNGRIETTPESYAGAAFTERRDDDGRPLDDSGSIRAADGRDGGPGGDIRLFVAEVDWGDGGIARLVTDGSPGELGENGGTLPFVPRKNGPPTKNLDTTVTRAQVGKIFGDAAHSTQQLKDVKHWTTEGGVGEKGLDTTWGYMTGDALSHGQLIEYSGYAVTDVRIGLAFQKVLAWVYNEVRVPRREGPSRWQVVEGVSLLIDKAWEKTREIPDPWTPSDGEDAFPSGTTGRGGAAGTLSVPANVQVPDKAFSGAGGASERSPEVPGGAAGTPQKYMCIAFNASQFAPDPLNPTKSLTNLLLTLEHARVTGETKPGEKKEGSARGAGAPGSVTVLDNAQGWMEPRLLRTVADHARELYHAGQRQRAWELLAPYWRASREATSQAARATDARSSLRSISNLVENYQQNLDVYGNPPGWVPRFSASSYLQTYLADRQFSYRFVGVMEQATRLMDSLEHAATMLDGLAASGEEAIDRVRDELFASFVRYDSASRSLEESRAALERAQQRLTALENDATHRAAMEAHDKAVVKAVFDISGAILKAIPAYQPMLAGVGTVLESVGGVVVDGMGTGGSVNGWSAMEKISGSVATTLKDNAGSFKSQFQDGLKEKYKDQLNPDDVDLRTNVEQLRTQIATGQEDFDRAILTAQEEVSRNTEVSDLLSPDLSIAERLAGQATHRDEVLAELRKLNSTLEGLDAPSGNGVAVDAAARARQRLLIARAKLFTVLANTQNEIRDLERDAAADGKRRDELNARRAVVTAHREELEAKQAKLKKLLPDFEKLEANTRMKKATKTFDQALDGAERLAKGAASIAGSIRAATAVPDPESAEVLALRAKILEGPLGEEYAAIQEEVEAATGTMSEALAELMSCNQRVLTLSADFTGALQSSIDVARNRLSFARGVDAGLRTSLVAMQRQAHERMDYYLYLFRRAYMYEYCRLPGRDIATLNTFIRHLDQWLKDSRTAISEGAEAEARNDALRGLSLLTSMSDKAIGDLGNDALRNTLSELANQLLKRRQGQGAPIGNELLLTLQPEQLETLCDERSFEVTRTIDLIPRDDDRAAFQANPLLRVTGIQLKSGDVHIQAEREPPPMQVVIEFGRELPLWDGKRHTLFRIASSETPLRFGFMANRFERVSDGLWQCVFVADGRGDADELFHTVATEAMGKRISYSEINPSFLAALRISIRMGAQDITAIPRFRMTVGWQSN